MGALMGHVFPGAVFFISGFWSTINIFRCLTTDREFKHQFWYHSPCFRTNKPLEPFIKIGMCVIGVLIEMGHSARWSLHDDDGNLDNMNDFQHATMYVSFLIASVVDIILSRGSKLTGLDGLIYFLAFTGEGLMFYFHLHGRDHVDIQIHTLLVISCFGCAVGAAFARWRTNNPILSMGYALAMMTHGTWFIHAGFLLYPPGQTNGEGMLDPDDMESVMYVTDWFVLHALCHFVLLLFCYLIVKLFVQPTAVAPRRSFIKHADSDLEMYRTVRSSTRYTRAKLYPDSD